MRGALAVLMCTALMVCTVVRTGAADDAGAAQNKQEDDIGRQVYQDLEKKGEIIRESPLYDVLRPIAQQIKGVADPQYYRPFTFYLVHESQPNAFAVPGGNVYVTDSLMRFVENREELAGVLCHETSHDIHHDVINNMAKDKRAQTRSAIGALVVNVLTGGRAASVVNTAADFNALAAVNGYSRAVETAADLKGAETCAQAGSNPWGMVWLFRAFGKSNAGGNMEMLSDHPRDDHRIADLEAHFKQNPALFGSFDPAIAHATKLPVPKGGTQREDDSRGSPK